MKIFCNLLTKNCLGGDTLKFENDKALFAFALSKLSQVHDPDELICSQAVTLNRAQLKSQKSKYACRLAVEEARSNLGHTRLSIFSAISDA